MKLASQIRRLRLKRGLTQKQLGQRVGMKQAVISRLEGGARNGQVTVLTLKRIAKGLRAKVEIRLHHH